MTRQSAPRRRRGPVALIIGAVVAMLALTGCSYVTTDSNQRALVYEGGSFSSKKFQECVTPSQRSQSGPQDRSYVYPSESNQRTYDATGGGASEAKPYTVVTKDSVEMAVPVTMTFFLKSDNCENFRKFHEGLGLRYNAWWEGSSEDFVDANEDDMPDGWVTMLNFVIGNALDITMDRQANEFDWRALWNNPTTKAQFQDAVEKNIGTAIQEQANGDFFKVGQIQVKQPTPVNENLRKAVAEEQQAVAGAKSAEAKANADKAAAEAQIAVARAEAAQIAERVRVLGADNYVRMKALEQNINPYPPTIVGPAPAGK